MDRMGFKFMGSLHIIVVGEQDPAQADWHAYVEAIQAEATRGASVGQMRTLVFSDGGGPNAAQRRVTRELREGQNTPQAIVTHRRITRAVITALRLWSPHVRAFPPHDLRGALEFLGVPEIKLRQVVRLAGEIQLGLGIAAVKSLELAQIRREPGVSLRS
jgi:hypothetical protein